MLKDRIVRVKLKKHYQEQKPISFIGKCTAFGENWLVIEGKQVMAARGVAGGVQIDTHAAHHVVARDNVESIRVLPEDFNIAEMKLTTEGQQLRIVVDGKRDCYIGELGEG
jgi:hypothetical protein